MKSFILITALLAIFITISQVKADWKDDLRKLDEACRQDTRVSEDELKAFFKGDDKDPKESLKCHLKCVMEKQGHWKNGAFDDNAAKKHMLTIPGLKEKQDEINKAVDECKTKKGSNECDTAYLITKCFKENKANVM